MTSEQNILRHIDERRAELTGAPRPVRRAPPEHAPMPEAYAAEQARIRKCLEVYRDLGMPGVFAYGALSDVLDRANLAAASHDTAAMVALLEEMRGCE